MKQIAKQLTFSSRVCIECEESFNPSSNHKRCPKCRTKDRLLDRPLCECGGKKLKTSVLCYTCNHKTLSGYGDKNKNWKGGKTRHQQGYIMIKMPEHPRAKSVGYVFEHILVMEQKIGRLIGEDETVHHVNGIRDDNRPETLELWTKNHPAGTRVVDAIAWAIEILKLNAPELLK